ncbi:Dipeptidyl aminopeptidase/acylaminoacyl peptidase [Microbulbifer donghaiensis]|uniref:Dipeptidyl aminopeptidase/acylaminoacyl peptidase n=1 Tax=Microbulbifer donghaiensis TaxID=494016 RepID=A0A1M4VQ65_9GAMM|nr:S9 family peptidase [Microbulbifer donghaiensis]SHE71000.1 Dipeptidyl aminopeptidase/acylaminoacyl peptidase [Microbulbifer donghaiensis]
MSESPADQIAPYGSWKSAIRAELLVEGSVRLSEASLVDGCCYWLESRPAEKGRSVLVQFCPQRGRRDLLPAPLSIRSKAHEYGGASYLVCGNSVFFVLAEDQRIYRMDLEKLVPEAITVEGDFRYADLFVDRVRQRLICVQEDHAAAETGGEARARILSIDLQAPLDSSPQILAEGADFYSNPSLSPNSGRLSFLRWHHPNMPWDATELCLAELDKAGTVLATTVVAGGDNESIFQPQWSPEGELFYVSDRNNWWNIYRMGHDEPLWDKHAEFATPQWVFGMSTYGFLNSDEMLCTFTEEGRWHLARIDIHSGEHRVIEQPFSDIESLRCESHRAVMIAAGADSFPAVVTYDNHSGTLEIIASSNSNPLPEAVFSLAQEIEFPAGERHVYGFYYPPHNPQFTAPAGEKPPLIVFSHGGPTGATSAGLNLKIQYWTSRGFAILDVNYSGSTGYGRDYRERLTDSWGITDVEDVCAGAEYLVAKGLADPDRLLIKGGSAGGYTVLAALTYHNTFKAGASHYGIGDLTTLARDTHKFESRYLDKLVGSWPDSEHIYRARSPINHVEQLDCPVIFFQGLEDKVVPPNQAQTMVDALKRRGIPVAYITFANEGHGFRSGDSIKLALEGELEFYSRIFKFPLPEPGPGITIENLD